MQVMLEREKPHDELSRNFYNVLHLLALSYFVLNSVERLSKQN